MAENYGKPVNVTGPDGQQMVANRNSQGLVISENGTDIMTVGYGRDQSLGFSFNDGTNERIFIGRSSTGSIFFKFAQAGFDAKTATDDQLIMSSDFNMMKIVNSGQILTTTVSVTDGGAGVWSSASSLASVEHGITDYIPSVIGYLNLADLNYILLPYTINDSSGSTASFKNISIYVDSVNVNVSVNITALHTAASFIPQYVKYYLFRETAA